MANTYGVIVAGGIGSRMGCKDKPKQFMLLDGKPIIIRTIERFCGIDELREIIVLCPAEWVDYTEDLVREYLPDHLYREMSRSGDDTRVPMGRVTVIPGGDTRNETIMRAIDHIEEAGDLDDDTVIVTHDSVRPFVTEEIIRENIAYALGDVGVSDGSDTGFGEDAGFRDDTKRALTDSGRIRACTTAVTATDTILISDGESMISEMPDRSRSYQCQTPQTFPAKRLRELYRSLSEEERDVLTDAARIFLMKGEKVHIVEGSVSNIKITYPQDMAVAEAILSGENEKS